ncbi:hypothetical protein HJC23_012990 [Cyclotella cryptica]|uniref:Uncharacterized protein n=1 Tax=Cyclotella cryptica TaxID=29204 RepID=A0ABD3QFR6_9STRA|eukprot:CCRYP_005597-RA/>CCRYP_005597-RA protein AED:0.19 eAED:0.19 QI:189/1/1/1/1/1/4/1059/546
MTSVQGQDVKIESHASVPYRGFTAPTDPLSSGIPSTSLAYPSPSPVEPSRPSFKSRLFNFLGPRSTDVQQLIRKLEEQFQTLQVQHLKYQYETRSAKDPTTDPNHPVHAPQTPREIHFVGRSAQDPAILQLTTFLTNHDMFGAITELWLGNNLLSDEGATALASYLQLPRCPLVEVWLGQNRIGPVGTAMLAAALGSNEKSRLKCLGLNQNPIENAGAGCLAQMLRGNHTLITVDVHGCMFEGNKRTGFVDDEEEEEEAYGCKIVKINDGKEYVARIDNSSAEEKMGYVTDQRLLDAITTFSAFNKINPTREQAIRGLTLRNRRIKAASAKVAGGDTTEDTNTDNTEQEQEQETMVSQFLSDLRALPSTERLTPEEKRRWKDCEWERLYVEIERARAARSALEERLKIQEDDNVGKLGEDEIDNDAASEEEQEEEDGEGGLGEIVAEKEERLGRDLDDEIVRTESRSWRDLKMGIAGSAKVATTDQNRSVKKKLVAVEKKDDAPKNPFKENNLAPVPESGGDEELSEGVGSEDDESEQQNAEVKFV